MNVEAAPARNKLAALWFVVSGVLFLASLLLWLLPMRRFGEELWSWLLPTIVPTLSLMTAIYVREAQGAADQRTVSVATFRLAFWTSAFYLFVVMLLLLVQTTLLVLANGASEPLESLDLFQGSAILLPPLQGIVSGLVGIFFVAQGEEVATPR